MSEENIEQIGQAEVDQIVSPIRSEALAGRGIRLVAVIIDVVLFYLALAPSIIALIVFQGDPTVARGTSLAFGTVAMLAYAICQGYLLTTKGQTIGKGMMKIRIVRYGDGGNPGFLRAILVRGLLPGLIGLIPTVGPVLVLIDLLFIFGAERRRISDLVADTKVVVESLSQRDLTSDLIQPTTI